MHLLATASGVIDGGAEPIDLNQTPADLLVLTAADSEIALLAQALDRRGGPTLRLANYLQLQHNYSVDLYAEKTASKARLIVLRLLGGASYWSYGLDRIEAMARERRIPLAVLPGDTHPDPELMGRSTLPLSDCEQLRQYLVTGGMENAASFLTACDNLLNGTGDAPPPRAPSRFGIYRETRNARIAIVFYRSVVEGAQTAPIDALVEAFTARGIGCVAIYVASLKDQDCSDFIVESLSASTPGVILNATSFAVRTGDPLRRFDCPVIQVVLAGSPEQDWRDGNHGLGPRDLAMNVVLPELDGRIMSRAISFKADTHWHAATQCRIVNYQPVDDRVAFVADLASNWLNLGTIGAPDRRIAIVLANYPDKDGRIANGVGYDTPASTIAILDAMTLGRYATGKYPPSGNGLIEALQRNRNNAEYFVSLAAYQCHFDGLPDTIRTQITSRWGAPTLDPLFRDGTFCLPVHRFGNVCVAIQPARGYNIDPKTTYHDPALVPPHGYLAFYFWLHHVFGAHAIIHNGKHGNLEWLPGKSVALSAECYPEIALGPVPHLYPFIVNDPGEGTQAKRRSSAVIIDHLTPPLTRAETYGPLKDLEALIDEYYLASGLDRRRLAALRVEIIELTRSHRLDIDAGLTGDGEGDLRKLDAYLCDLKEAQIRDGLHVLGSSPEGRLEVDLLVALTRVPRGLGEGGDQSLIRALAIDFGFGNFDPLACDMAATWTGPLPSLLRDLIPDPWRSNADVVERLELFAARLLSDSEDAAPPLPAMGEANKVRAQINRVVRPALRSCGPNEIAGLLAGLDGRFVAPGPSGAPTRGRLDVLPTGRNFFSLDNRTVPTPTAWTLGWKSAEDLLLRHLQDFGQYPKALGLSAWGTSNMRTGGDDIAQALAFIGVKPTWDHSSWRVIGFEIMPLAKLGRPRVDVTLRISGFFRDAFPAQIELFDRAVRAVAALDEDENDNPIASRVRNEAEALVASGVNGMDARHIASFRIFGSKPGSYGAGLQALIDGKNWEKRADLSAAYVTWSSYAYGAKDAGIQNTRAFAQRLKRIEAVVHNQDNREHDLLDSDDYYQFEGGMSAAVEQESGQRPRTYHNDHSRPERPIIRTLEEEVGRVMRSRVVNPKWIAGVKRHGYKGAFEIAATIDYMFAFAATTGAVRTHHFDLAFDAFLMDERTRQFIAANNPAALKEISERFAEAAARGLWTPRLNSAHDLLKELSK